jgi:two-component system chemotaxis response regulator CheY
MKFLVVDDSPTMRRIVCNALQEIGYTEMAEAEDGKDALGKLDDSIDFLITDWNMPNMDGLELSKSIREDGQLASLPILMVTTRGMKEDVVQAMEADINNYVVKPFTPSVLQEKIDSILQDA